MKIVSTSEFDAQKSGFLTQLKSGSIVIYPTDTIYGVGCNALIDKCVKQIRALKAGSKMPFSIIVPSKEWITQNCIVPDHAQEWIDKLPGPYTLVFELKQKDFLANEISAGTNTVGIRIPNHWISSVVNELGYPLITTSVPSEQGYLTDIEELDKTFERSIDLFIEDGKLSGKPSQVIHLHTPTPKRVR